MDLINASCPRCGNRLEFPSDFDNVLCARCGSSYLVREHKGTINLSLIGEGAPGSIDEQLSALDEELDYLNSEIEVIRSKEKGAPLQTGCGVFRLFILAILVIAVFMTVAIDYFGRWPFYLALAVILALGLVRVRRRLPTPLELDRLKEVRTSLEADLLTLGAERERLLESMRNLSDSKAPR